MQIIDARGLGCPKPIIMAEEALSRIEEGMVTVIVDNEGAAENLKRYAERFSYFCEVKKEEKDWKVTIVKGYACQISKSKEEIKKKLLLVVTSHIIGHDENLGRILMKAFFETMLAVKQLPDTIFLMNTAVKFTTTDEEFIELLKKFEERGTEIFTCGTCLKFFNLENTLKVGFRGTTNHFVEGIFDFDKTVWVG